MKNTIRIIQRYNTFFSLFFFFCFLCVGFGVFCEASEVRRIVITSTGAAGIASVQLRKQWRNPIVSAAGFGSSRGRRCSKTRSSLSRQSRGTRRSNKEPLVVCADCVSFLKGDVRTEQLVRRLVHELFGQHVNGVGVGRSCGAYFILPTGFVRKWLREEGDGRLIRGI